MWEAIDEIGGDGSTTVTSHRLKVPGGWVVRTVASRYQGGTHAEQTFVADPSHTWELQQQ